jgi:hypothetical protein
MSEIDFSDPDRLLDQIVLALREEPIPEFTDTCVDIVSAKSGQNDESAVRPPLSNVEPQTSPRWLFVSAAISGIAALIFVMLSHGPSGGPGAAFAEVQQAVARSKSMSCRTLDFHGDKDPSVSAGVSVPGVGSRSDGPNGWVSITNLKARRSMWIDHRSRKAGIRQLYLVDGEKDTSTGIFEKLRNLPASGAKLLGTTDFNGKKVLEFAFESLGEFVVFVDPKTSLPLRMELKIEKGEGGKPFREVTTDFVFDAPVDESIFELKVPPGYAVSRCEEPRDRKPIDTQTWVASPENGLGPVPLHAMKEQILAILGTPDLIEETYRGPERFRSPGGRAIKGQKDIVGELLSYPSLGFVIDVSSKDGMTGFGCFGRLWRFESARDFLGKTDKQIGLGASIDEVLRAYGKPDVKTHRREDVLYYFHKGWTFLFRDGKLALMTASQPRSEDLEFKDTGDGGWTEEYKPKKKSP